MYRHLSCLWKLQLRFDSQGFTEQKLETEQMTKVSDETDLPNHLAKILPLRL